MTVKISEQRTKEGYEITFFTDHKSLFRKARILLDELSSKERKRNKEIIKKSNIPYYEEEREVILSMNVKGGVATAFSTKLTAREINELETLIEKLINKHIKEQSK